MFEVPNDYDSIWIALWGPEPGLRHDKSLLRISGWEKEFEDVAVINGEQYYVYYDAAYCIRPYVKVPFVFVIVTIIQQGFNAAMCKVIVAVEWNYKDLKQMWTENKYARSVKIRQPPITLLYIASALPLNFRTCLSGGGQAGTYLECRAPSVRAKKIPTFQETCPSRT